VIGELEAEVKERKAGVSDTESDQALFDLVQKLLDNEQKAEKDMQWLKKQADIQASRYNSLTGKIDSEMSKQQSMSKTLNNLRDQSKDQF